MSDHGTRDRTLRAGDADRETVAETLRAQHLAGRIDTDELQERVERCYAARTYGELDALLADLPAEDRPASTRRGWGPPRIALLPLLIVALALSHGRVLWLAVPLVFFFMCRTGWRASAPPPRTTT